jgi:hypothetical protein
VCDPSRGERDRTSLGDSVPACFHDGGSPVKASYGNIHTASARVIKMVL